VTLAQDDDSVSLTVADDGPGMDAATAGHVFDRFYRADQSRSTRTVGSGLGLAIVAASVEAHSGSIELDTAPGRGATFRVRLPLVATAV
jgi:two-component system OmpR family sensor kinase